MEVAPVSAATGALKPVLGKLATLLGDEYKRFKGVRGEIKSLSSELVAIEAFLLKMSEEEDPDIRDKVWMNEVRELSYDMEDSIDDFMQSVDGEDTKPDGFLEKMKNSLGKLGKMKARCRIGNEIHDMKKQITEVAERNERYKTQEAYSRIKNTTIDTRALAISEHVSQLVGIDEPKAEVIKLLTKGVRAQGQLKLVSIVGSGGTGKTTLANQVYQNLRGKFKCQAFLSVSRNPDMMNILRIILSEVSGQRYADTKSGSIQQLIIKISDFLAKKRYFVVLDDIWEMDTWNIIKRAFPMTSSGGIIITTTRINDVAESCRLTSSNGHVYVIRPLDMVHSKQLFHTRLFNSQENCPSHLKEVSKQILERCAGLPLAIIAISGLLANTERTEDQWKQVKYSIGRALKRNPSIEGMMKILSLSYFDLPPHLKSCLLYFSIFPEDSIIEKELLIKRWIAERLIHTQAGYTKYEFGERCFNELINRSLIQPIGKDNYDKVISCRLHDTILDFIISKSVEENFVTLVGIPSLIVGTERKVHRLSLQAGNQKELVVPSHLVLSHVRSLDVFGISVKIPSLDKFRYLRVLDFGGCKQLENHHLENIGTLSQLRYLNLRGAEKVTKLPQQIRHLLYLETMDLRETNICELPASIIDLKSLVQLFIGYNSTLPCGISKMQALEQMERVTISKQSFNVLQEFGQLQSLKRLALDFSCSSRADQVNPEEESKKSLIVASINNVGNLLSLTINSGSLVGQSLCPVPLSLQRLETWHSAILQLPKWVGSLLNLQQLHIEVHRIKQEDFYVLGGLPALNFLSLFLEKDHSLSLLTSSPERSKDTMIVISGEVGFSSLSIFHYFIPDYGMNLTFEAGAMPNVHTLAIQFDASETESLHTSGAFGIRNLPSLITIEYEVYGNDSKLNYAAMDAISEAANAHPNNPSVSPFPCIPDYLFATVR